VAKPATKYTLWTKPKGDWTPVLGGAEFTDAVRSEVEKAIQSLDDSNVVKRLEPYDTPVTPETLSQFVK